MTKASTCVVRPQNKKVAHAEPVHADMSELQLIEQCQLRDQTAFRYLITRYRRTVLSVLHRLAPEQRDTSDIEQEVFIRIWTSIGRLRSPYSFRTWLTQITTNVFYDELRRRRHLTVPIDCIEYPDHDSAGSLLQIADKAASPDQLLEQRELSRAVERALMQMPHHSQLLIRLRDLEGLSYKEISEVTQTSLGTVKSRIARARAKMQCLLSPYLAAGQSERLKISA